jgi:hypothetical protein
MRRTTALLGALTAGVALAAASATQAIALGAEATQAARAGKAASAPTQAAFMMPTQDVIFIGERTPSQAYYGTRPGASAVPTGAIERALDLDVEATSNPAPASRLRAMLQAGGDPCPPLLAVCTVSVLMEGGVRGRALPAVGDELFDLRDHR